MALPHQRFGDPICSSKMGTRIFAIVNLILLSGLSICCTVGMAYIPQKLADVEHNRTEDGSPADIKAIFGVLNNVILMLGVTFIVYISLMFASLLVYGFFKKVPGYIKAYLWYGLIVEILSAIAIIVAFIPDSNGDFIMPVSASGSAIVGLFIYVLILVMIRKTYTEFDTLQVQYNPQALETKEAQAKNRFDPGLKA